MKEKNNDTYSNSGYNIKVTKRKLNEKKKKNSYKTKKEIRFCIKS